jgi:tRNA(Ser,Leu) C12 N-acetylase TAN1
MLDWNVVVSVYEDGYKQALRVLRPFGRLQPTDFYNVLVMKVGDISAFLEQFAALVTETPGVLNDISRVMPCEVCFDYESAQEFESKARDVALSWVLELAQSAFHVRMHRRGFKGRLSSHDEERFLDAVLLTALEEAGTPGRITFEDPDAIISIETVGQRAGLSFWRRQDLERYPFLRLD